MSDIPSTLPGPDSYPTTLYRCSYNICSIVYVTMEVLFSSVSAPSFCCPSILAQCQLYLLLGTMGSDETI
jgi:hypothetical protein